MAGGTTLSLEGQVASLALRLASDDPVKLFGAHDRLCAERKLLGVPAKLKYSRLLQELLAYKRGALVQRLLDIVLQTNLSTCEDVSLSVMAAFTLLMTLSESQLVARFCLKDDRTTVKLAKAVVAAYTRSADTLSARLEPVDANVSRSLHFLMVTDGVRGLVNFARVSKSFRQALQRCPSPFQSLQGLFSDRFTGLIDLQDFMSLQTEVTKVVDLLGLFEDSQQWGIDQGLIRIRGAMYIAFAKYFPEPWAPWMDLIEPGMSTIALELHGHKYIDLDRRIRDPGEADANALRASYLEEVKEILEETATSDLVSGIHEASPGLLGPMETLRPEDPYKTANSLAAWASRRSVTPLVCSWELCTVGSAADAERPFSKCAKCSLAYYCCKEHQTLHWRTHKKQCRNTSQ